MSAQSIVRMNLPQDICTSDPTTVTIGYNESSSAVIFTAQATLGHSERIFLPDGQSCYPYGCSYRSPVTFDAFAPGTTITSVEDIDYVRLNIEHSYIGDIYINITCPNGNKADLMRYGGSGTSGCNNSIPNSSVGWSNGNNCEYCHFGDANDVEGSDICDSTSPGNEPGVGWNYCWSNRATAGFTYANGDGIIYRYRNASNNNTIDSSNTANKSNFYHPDDNFSNLIGCPLNGTWFIEVVDGWSVDNGYIFEWELSLNSSLIPVQCEVTSRQLIGPYAQRVNDSSFTINWPSTITHDTTIEYTFRLLSSCGTTYDTTVAVNLHPTYNTNQTITGCNSVTYNGHTYTGSTNLTRHLTSRYGCDSTAHINIVVENTLYTDLYDTVVQNSLPYQWHGQTLTAAGTRTTTLTSHTGCDSVVTLHLHVWPNVTASADTAVCESTLPLVWNGVTFTSASSATTLLTTTHGADSLLTMTVEVIPTQSRTVTESVIENDLPHTFGGTSFTNSVTDTLFRRLGARGCDSLTTYTLNVWWNTATSLDTTICNNRLPLQWHGHSFNAASSVTDNLFTTHGADSTVHLTLHVNPTYYIEVSAEICDNESFRFEGIDYTSQGNHQHNFLTVDGCDSIRTLKLSVRATSAGDTTADLCDMFSWHGQSFTYGNIPPLVTDTLVNAAGCDSVVTLHLTLRTSTASAYHDTVVENLLPRLFNRQSFSTDTHHSPVVITNAAGCDSTIDYSLHVYWNVDTTLYKALCNSSLPHSWPHTYGTVTQTASFDTTVATSAVMSRSVTIPAHTGADSIITMLLTVHPLYDHHTTATICDSQWNTAQQQWAALSYTFGDSTFRGTDGSTVHTDSLLSIHGCDSLSTLHLAVNHAYEHHLADTVCTNTPYTWGTPQRTVVQPYSIDSHYTAAHDTAFMDRLHTVVNCDSLSYLHLLLVAAYDYHHHDTICAAHITAILPDSSAQWQQHTYTYETGNFNATGTYPFHLQTQSPTLPSCDSVRTLHLKVYPTHDIHIYDTIYDGDTYSFEAASHDTTGIFPRRLQGLHACDSLRTLHLQRNWRTYNDSTLCQNSLPFTWNNVVFIDNTPSTRTGNTRHMSDSVHLAGRASTDSLVVMRVHVIDTSAYDDVRHACDSLLWQDGVTYYATVDTPSITFANAAQCDSVVHLRLTVDYTHFYTDSLHACDSMQWIDRRWYFSDTAGHAGPVGSHSATGPVDTLVTTGQCDSVVSLKLAVHYSTYGATPDTFCYNQTYLWHGQSVNSDSAHLTIDYYLTDTLLTVWQCDSIVGLHLTKMARPQISFAYDIDCAHQRYDLTVATDVGYSIWSSADTSLDGQELLRDITVSPTETSCYYIYTDYHQAPLCPLVDSICLPPVLIPDAQLRVSPARLSYSDLEYNAYDMSSPHKGRIWYVDSVRQLSTSPILTGTADVTRDTTVIWLSIYNGQCWDTASQAIAIRKVYIYAPNAFTPNGDNNRRFILVTGGVIEGELRIYNRDGLLVYTTRDFGSQGWDGGSSPQGNYVWTLRYRAIEYPDTWQRKTGSVLLIR